MPRPKVKPQDRQRSIRACDTCKASKKRCDANQPCRLCLKKGTQDTCTYSPTTRDRKSRHSQSQSEASQTNGSTAAVSNAGAVSELGTTIPSLSLNQRPRAHFSDQPAVSQDPQPQAGQAGVDEGAESETDFPDSRNSVERTAQQRSVLLYSSSGDKVFVGNTAALSFLRFLQHTLKHYVGPSGFTDRQHSHNWFEVTESTPEDADFFDDLNDEEKDDLLHCYLDVSSGFLDLYSHEELAELTRAAGSAQLPDPCASTQLLDKTALASFYLMIAIGFQVRGRSKDDLVRASKYFTHGRKLAFEKMLEDATVNLVRAFILLAFYMFGACRRNSAFMYLGVAAKSADILGLHAAAQNKRMTKTERDSRLRVAKSIRVFDIICSSILGRRSSAPSLRSVDVTSGDMEQEQNVSCHRALALRANYESCSILETVVGKFADDGALSASSAEQFLQLLKEWSEVLPVSLRQRPRKGDQNSPHSPGYREKMIANIHVAGTYYFGIILVTRQFLIQHIMPQLRGHASNKARAGHPQQNGHSSGGSGSGSGNADAVGELARACIGAATYLAQMCREAVDAGVFRSNMCIIKAWVFAAGLVLGFALLAAADDASDAGARGAFRGSQHVLSALGRLSAQARQYHNILATFSEAIDKYRRQMRRERTESRVPFVEQILSYDGGSYAAGGVSLSLSVSDEQRGVGGVSERDYYHRRSGEDIMIDTEQTTQTQHQQQQQQQQQQQEQEQEPQHPQYPPAVLDMGLSHVPASGFNVDGMAVGEGGFWNGSDDLSSTSEFLPDHWPSPADNELMLRILWDGYTMSFEDPIPPIPNVDGFRPGDCS